MVHTLKCLSYIQHSTTGFIYLDMVEVIDAHTRRHVQNKSNNCSLMQSCVTSVACIYSHTYYFGVVGQMVHLKHWALQYKCNHSCAWPQTRMRLCAVKYVDNVWLNIARHFQGISMLHYDTLKNMIRTTLEWLPGDCEQSQVGVTNIWLLRSLTCNTLNIWALLRLQDTWWEASCLQTVTAQLRLTAVCFAYWQWFASSRVISRHSLSACYNHSESVWVDDRNSTATHHFAVRDLIQLVAN